METMLGGGCAAWLEKGHEIFTPGGAKKVFSSGVLYLEIGMSHYTQALSSRLSYSGIKFRMNQVKDVSVHPSRKVKNILKKRTFCPFVPKKENSPVGARYSSQTFLSQNAE